MDAHGNSSFSWAEARSRFEDYAEYLAREEPGLGIEVKKRAKYAAIVGSLAVDVGAGVPQAFRVEIQFEGLDPFRTPRVWDAGRRFRPDGERHVEDHGQKGWRFCLELDAAPDIDFRGEEGLASLLAHLRGFIRKQLIYEHRKARGHPKPWPGPAWHHGRKGYMEWLNESLAELGPDDLRRLRPFTTVRPLAANKSCPCGSGKKARECHREMTERLRTSENRVEINRALDELIERREADDRRSPGAD